MAKKTYYINREPGHNKFYIIERSGTSVTTVNGRLGTGGTVRVEQCSDQWDAESYANRKHHDRLNHNYEVVALDEFKKAQTEAAIVGSANKCSKIEWLITNKGDKIATDSEMQDPANKVALHVVVETRKKYDGENDFEFIIEEDSIEYRGTSGGYHPVDESSEVFKLTSKIMEAVAINIDEAPDESDV